MFSKRRLYISVSVLLLFFTSFCNSSEHHPKNNKQQNGFPYDLLNPAERNLLPVQLREISGLAYYNGIILCIQDEAADIYSFDPAEKKVTGTFRFDRKGDFEDIAVAGDTAYLLKSNGKIVEIQGFTGETPEVREYETPLKSENDTEGLAYEQASNSLLITCKGYPDIGKSTTYKGSKTVYRFDLRSKELYHNPVLVINLKNPACFSDTSVYVALRNSAARIPSLDGFQPSALTVKPSTGEIYMISSSGRLILVINKEGKITDFRFLPMNIFIQPEGICFLPSGDLYISSEGRAGNGYILRFIAQ